MTIYVSVTCINKVFVPYQLVNLFAEEPLDDVGFAHLGCYGSPIEMPNMDRLAANGLLYNNFHTTGMCLCQTNSLRTISAS